MVSLVIIMTWYDSDMCMCSYIYACMPLFYLYISYNNNVYDIQGAATKRNRPQDL